MVAGRMTVQVSAVQGSCGGAVHHKVKTPAHASLSSADRIVILLLPRATCLRRTLPPSVGIVTHLPLSRRFSTMCRARPLGAEDAALSACDCG